jgi:hypothetical protein
MSDLLRNFLQFLGSMDWPAIAQGVAGIWMAIIATIALNMWRRQTKAQKHIDFMDELTDTIHAFILSMSAPVSSLKFAKIGIDSYAGIHDQSEDIKNPEAVAFIKKRGKSTRDDIREHLDAVRPILSKMKSLVAKGQVFGIENYSKCQNACSMLEWSYNQIEVFSSIIGDPHLNWNHPNVQQVLDKVLSIDPERIESNLAEQNSEFLLFARQAYDKILK